MRDENEGKYRGGAGMMPKPRLFQAAAGPLGVIPPTTELKLTHDVHVDVW